MSLDNANGGRFWQILILSVVILFLCAMIVTFSTAVRGVSRVVDPDYYDHGLHYGSDGERLRNAEILGWRMATVISGDHLEIRVNDGEGNPVGGGKVTLIPEETDSQKVRKGSDAWAGTAAPAGAEKAHGVYSIALDKGNVNDLKGRIVFTRGDAALSGKLVVLR